MSKAKETTLMMAMRKAKYGHRNWIYWRPEGGEGMARRLDIEGLDRAMSAAPGHAFVVGASTGTLTKISDGIARVLRSNLAASRA